MYDNEGKEKTSGTSEKEETKNPRQEETAKSCDGYISIYEYGKNVYHSTYERVHIKEFFQWSIYEFYGSFVELQI